MSEEVRTQHREQTGLSDAEFSDVMAKLGSVAPLVRGVFDGAGEGGATRSAACRGRESLLLALKPYLSPTRCEMVDYLIRMARLGDLLRALQ